jgi:hypothetical protein
MQRAEKKNENVAELKATVEPRQRYEENVPLAGVGLPGVPPLPVKLEKRA